jgi:hypothetical protein
LNSSYNLNWGALRATSCAASGGWSGSKSLSNFEGAPTPLAEDVTYTLTCNNSYGSDSKSVTLKRDCPSNAPYSNGQCISNTPPTPKFALTADNAQRDLNPGETVTLSYDTTGHTGCSVQHLDKNNVSGFALSIPSTQPKGTTTWVATVSSAFVLLCTDLPSGYSGLSVKVAGIATMFNISAAGISLPPVAVVDTSLSFTADKTSVKK